MQYDPHEIEQNILKFWEENNTYEKIKVRNKKGKKFYFLQGPPYTSGRLHIGHAWNNSLKDVILRYKRMQGFNVWDRAGYDMHGLPVENKVQKNLGFDRKTDIEKYGVDKFVTECIKFAEENAKIMDKDLLRLGVWLDYENAYWPIKNEYIENEWWLIKKAQENKRLYKGKKVMTWCASCETALAKHELEYETVTEQSIFLKFKVKDTNNEFLLVWTTTPWTIPFNLAVMVNPDIEYQKVKVDNEYWIIAKPLANIFISAVAGKKYEVISEFNGEKLKGVKYIHPLTDDIPEFKKIKNNCLHTVLLSEEYVDTSAGTGLVHCAPGCGPEDQEVGAKVGLPAFNKLDERGVFTGMGKYDGKVAKVDDPYFIEELKKKGALIETTTVEHEYAHCWRCHKPVVFRSTEQWFLKIEDLREKLIKNNNTVTWNPDVCKIQYDSWTKNLKDNSITRQRYWGCPVPIWECSCGEITVVESREELKKLGWKGNLDNLHRPWIDDVKIKCPKCKKDVFRVRDVIDVWIDSGTASFNCLDYPKEKKNFNEFFPADLILEGTEQVRLWFSMLAICSEVSLNKPCFNNVYAHGMILDYQGTKMSKSLGNIISPYEVVDKYGADILRYYICETNAGENINFSWDDIKIKQRNMTILWNLHTFLINLAKELGVNPFTIKKSMVKLSSEEKYILSRLHSTIKKVTLLFEDYKLDETIAEIEKLFLDLSRVYIQLVRDKSSIGTDDEKEAVVYAVKEVLFNAVKMFSVISPFITEQIYQNFKVEFNIEEESIHMFEWPECNEKLIDTKLESDMDIVQNVIQALLSIREKMNRGIRWPLAIASIETQNKDVKKSIENLEDLIKTQCNIKEIEVVKVMKGIKQTLKPNYAKLGPLFGKDAPILIAEIAKTSPESILSHIEKEGHFKVKILGKTLEVKKEHLIIDRLVPEHLYIAESKFGLIYVDNRITKELEIEGFAREIARRVQMMRKSNSLKRSDLINLLIVFDEELAQKHKEYIKSKCGVETLTLSSSMVEHNLTYTTEEKIKGKTVKLSFSLV